MYNRRALAVPTYFTVVLYCYRRISRLTYDIRGVLNTVYTCEQMCMDCAKIRDALEVCVALD